MYKFLNVFSSISFFFLKITLGIIFFNYGYGKLLKMLNNEGDQLINMVSQIPVFGLMPVFFSWSLALSETLIIFGFIYGTFSFFPFSNFISRLAAISSLIISLVIVYAHVFMWGDNIFAYGPFELLNISEGKKSIYGQFLFIPISLCILFNNRNSLFIPNENKKF